MLYIVTEGDRPEKKTDEMVIRDVMKNYISHLGITRHLPKETIDTLLALEHVWPECLQDGAAVISSDGEEVQEEPGYVKVIFMDAGGTYTIMPNDYDEELMLETLTPCFQAPLLVTHFMEEILEFAAPPARTAGDADLFVNHWLDAMIERYLKEKRPITMDLLCAWCATLHYCLTTNESAVETALAKGEENIALAKVFLNEEDFEDLSMPEMMVEYYRNMAKIAGAAALAGQLNEHPMGKLLKLSAIERVDCTFDDLIGYVNSGLPKEYHFVLSALTPPSHSDW